MSHTITTAFLKLNKLAVPPACAEEIGPGKWHLDDDCFRGLLPGGKSRPRRDRPIPVAKLMASGPGTELKRLFKQLGIKADACGGCLALLVEMNQWGPDGCRARLDQILLKIEANKKTAGIDWADKLAAGVSAILQGLPKSLRGLVLLAIERAETQPGL